MAKTCISRAQRAYSCMTWPKIADPITGELKPMSSKRTITLHYPNPIDPQAKAAAKAARAAKWAKKLKKKIRRANHETQSRTTAICSTM